MAQSESRSERVTLKDVAEKAGVSLATASKVMNGRADVRQATRETVAQAARELGYEPKRRETDGRRSALIHFDTLTSPYSLQVLEGAEQAAHRAGVDLLVISGDQTPAGLTRAWMADAAARGVEGVILVTTPIGAQHARWSKDLRLPLIAIDPVSIDPDVNGIVTISATNWEGGSTAVQHLLDLGHRHIGVLAGPKDSVPARQRVQGYHSALGAAGVCGRRSSSRTGTSPTRTARAAPSACSSCPSRPPRSSPWPTPSRSVRSGRRGASRSRCPTSSAWSASTTR